MQITFYSFVDIAGHIDKLRPFTKSGEAGIDMTADSVILLTHKGIICTCLIYLHLFENSPTQTEIIIAAVSYVEQHTQNALH